MLRNQIDTDRPLADAALNLSTLFYQIDLVTKQINYSAQYHNLVSLNLLPLFSYSYCNQNMEFTPHVANSCNITSQLSKYLFLYYQYRLSLRHRNNYINSWSVIVFFLPTSGLFFHHSNIICLSGDQILFYMFICIFTVY